MVRRHIRSSNHPRLHCAYHSRALGIVIVLFFQCMGAFFDPVNRSRGGTKWGFVAHTAAMFSFATIYIAMSSNIQSVSFIDNREFPASVNGVSGPVGYQFFISSEAICITPTLTILLNNWLADGLLVTLYNSVPRVFGINCFSSSIVAMLYMPRPAGSSPSHPSCTSPP